MGMGARGAPGLTSRDLLREQTHEEGRVCSQACHPAASMEGQHGRQEERHRHREWRGSLSPGGVKDKVCSHWQ